MRAVRCQINLRVVPAMPEATRVCSVSAKMLQIPLTGALFLVKNVFFQ
jgi:hypothetical protein